MSPNISRYLKFEKRSQDFNNFSEALFGSMLWNFSTEPLDLQGFGLLGSMESYLRWYSKLPWPQLSRYLFDFSPGHPQPLDWVGDRGAAVAPAAASVASPAGRSHASAPVAQMVAVLLKPPKEAVDLKMNLSTCDGLERRKWCVCVFCCDVRSFIFLWRERVVVHCRLMP